MKNRAENSMVLEDGVQDGNAIRRRDFLYMTGMVVAVGLFIPNIRFEKLICIAGKFDIIRYIFCFISHSCFFLLSRKEKITVKIKIII